MERVNTELLSFNVLPNESWSFIPNVRKKYIVSTHGRVASFSGNKFKIRSLAIVGRGYLSVSISDKGKRKDFYVHRLVAMTFIPNKEDYPQVNHKDENKKNNHVDNLEWCTPKYNLEYSGVTARWRASGTKASSIIRTQDPAHPIKDKNIRLKIYRFKLYHRASKVYSYTKDGRCLLFDGLEEFAKHFGIDVDYATRLCFCNYYLNSLEYSVLHNYPSVLRGMQFASGL